MSNFSAVALVVGFAGGAINAAAGGGPIIVVAVLAASGVAADIASLTSTVALLPGQVVAGWKARSSLAALGSPPRQRAAIGVTLTGGAIGAGLLLVTPPAAFAGLLPFLICFAISLYALNSRRRLNAAVSSSEATPAAVAWLIPLSVYGGFYGGGNSFMVLALLAHGKVPPRAAAHAKNLLILLMNSAATGLFLTSGKVDVAVAVPLGVGALAGAAAGTSMIDRLDPHRLRQIVIVLGIGLAIWLLTRR